tara:strand:+ start:71 stop:994 length:924 start_codon:yes stop_codon:yes gene_type:complete
MKKNEKIVILAGGISKERKISISSGNSVYKELLKNDYKNVQILDADKNLIKNLRKTKPKIIFNALHGTFGEDGFIQFILEKLKIKYTHSGVISSSIAMNKVSSKKIFIKNKILTPKYLLYNFDINKKIILKKIKKYLGFPIVIKPISEGSSVDVHICKKNNFYSKLNKLRKYKEILIEEYISGREIQVAILCKKKIGAIELKPKRSFYDYKAKYNRSAGTRHIIPVQISKRNLDNVLTIAQKAHNLIKCRGVTRSDFRFHKNKFYLLELNTQPGMTNMSLVPEIAAYNGINFIKLIEMLIKDASINK